MKTVMRTGWIAAAMLLLFCCVWYRPQKAEAADSELYIAGIPVEALGQEEPSLAQGVEYDDSTHTLTLARMTMNSNTPVDLDEEHFHGMVGIGIYYTGAQPLTIQLEGSSSINFANGAGADLLGIYSPRAKVVFAGQSGASLGVLVGGPASGTFNAYGIYAPEIEIQGGSDGPVITAISGFANEKAYGVYGGVTASGGSLAAGCSVSAETNYGMYVPAGKSIAVCGGSVTAIGGMTDSEAVNPATGYGVYFEDADGVCTVESGSLTVNANAGECPVVGIRGNLLVKNGAAAEVLAESTDKTSIAVDGDLTVEGGNVKIESESEGNPACIAVNGTAAMNGGTAELIADARNGFVAANGAIVLGGRTIAVTASANADGSNPVLFRADQSDTYKYVRFLQGYDLWVGDVRVHPENAGDIFGDGKAVYDPQANELTLEGAALSAARTHPVIDCQVDADFKLHLAGANTLTQTAAAPVAGIASKGAMQIVFEDGAALDVFADERSAGGKTASYGLYAPGDLSLSGKGTLRVFGRDLSTNAYGSTAGIGVDGSLMLSGGVILETHGGACTGCRGPAGEMTESSGLVMAGENRRLFIDAGSRLTASGGVVTGGVSALPGNSAGLQIELPAVLELIQDASAEFSGFAAESPTGGSSVGMMASGSGSLTVDTDVDWSGEVLFVGADAASGVSGYDTPSFMWNEEYVDGMAFADASAVIGTDLPTDVSAGSLIAETGAANQKLILCPRVDYSVAVTAGEGMTPAGTQEQTVKSNRRTQDLTFAAEEGFYFPEDYAAQIAPVNGIQVTRDSLTQITVSGMPTADAQLALPAAAAKVQEQTPAAAFNANGPSSGTLSGLEAGLLVQVDDGPVQTASGASMALSGLSDGSTIQIIRPAADPDTGIDSETQIITVTKPAAPVLEAVQPRCIGETGSIPATDQMEYCTDGLLWDPCPGALTGLAPGSAVDIRFPAKGTSLESDILHIELAKPEHQRKDEGTVVKPATCTEPGKREYHCVYCDQKCGEEEIPATGHTEGEGTETTPATCTGKGEKTYYCTVCNEVCRTEEIPAKGHTPGDPQVIAEPTCINKGVRATYCTDCNTLLNVESIDKLEHVSDEGTVTPPTCTTDGVRIFRCTQCNRVLRQEGIGRTGHHADDGTVTTAPTCTKGGTKTFRCRDCGEMMYTRPVPATGHESDDGTVTKAATCTEDGQRTFRCKVCGEVVRTQIIRAQGHVSDSGTITKAPTCTERGEGTYRCTVCNEVLKTVPIAATGHESDDGVEMIAPTCTESGTRVYSCKSCHKVMEMETIPAKGHSFDAGKITTEPTCARPGVRTRTCTVCGEKKTEEVTGGQHVWDGGVVTQKATRSSEGVITYTCVICGATRTESTPMLVDSSIPMYRLFHPDTHEHFYTADSYERGVLLSKYGWIGEGVGWYAPKAGKPVYRLYNPQTTDHHYTMDAYEYEVLGNRGWIKEGIGWYSDPDQGVPLYRLFTPELYVGSHHYTSDTHERSVLLQSRSWQDEGIGWYGVLP